MEDGCPAEGTGREVVANTRGRQAGRRAQAAACRCRTSVIRSRDRQAAGALHSVHPGVPSRVTVLRQIGRTVLLELLAQADYAREVGGWPAAASQARLAISASRQLDGACADHPTLVAESPSLLSQRIIKRRRQEARQRRRGDQEPPQAAKARRWTHRPAKASAATWADLTLEVDNQQADSLNAWPR